MINNNHNSSFCFGLLNMAYSDYIAARILLNKDYTLQGVILASTAIEKYFKALVAICTGRKIHVHMDRFDKIQKIIEETEYKTVIDCIDSRFIDILGKAYKLRYYDNVSESYSVGFFKNQFLGELDGAVALFEKIFIEIQAGDLIVLTPLKQDLKKNNPDLFYNNWTLTKEKDKKVFMENNCIGFAIYINPNNFLDEIRSHSKPFRMEYNGTMSLIEIKRE